MRLYQNLKMCGKESPMFESITLFAFIVSVMGAVIYSLSEIGNMAMGHKNVNIIKVCCYIIVALCGMWCLFVSSL